MDFKKQVHKMKKELGRQGITVDFAIGDSLVTERDFKRLFVAASSIDDPLVRKRLQDEALYLRWLLLSAPPSISRPPRSVLFALLLIPKRNREHLVGDLEEEFRTIVLPQYGRFLAGCWYFEQVALAITCYAWPTIKKILGLSFILRLIGR